MSGRQRKRGSHFVRILINQLYFSGIIMVGAPVLINVNYFVAALLAMMMTALYLASNYSLKRTLVQSIFGQVFYRSGPEVESFVKTTLNSAVSTIAAVATVGILSFAITKQVAPARYYFYGLALAFVIFLVTFFTDYETYYARASSDGIETLKQKLALQIEFLRALMSALGVVVLVIAYREVIAGIAITPGEMILVAYTVLGALFLIFAPLIASILRLISRLREEERKVQPHNWS